MQQQSLSHINITTTRTEQMDNTLADIITKQGAPMRQQPPGTSRFSYQPLQLRERGYGEEEIDFALVSLISQFVTQSLEVLEVGLIGNVWCVCVCVCVCYVKRGMRE